MSLLPDAYASVQTPYYAPFGTTTGITTNLQVSTLSVNQAGNLFLTSDPLKPGIAAGIYFQSLGGTQVATWEQMNQNTQFGGTTSNQVSILNQAKTAYGDFAVGNFSIYGSGAVNGLPIAEFTERGISGQLEIRSPQINMSTLLVPELLNVSSVNGQPWNGGGGGASISTFSTFFISTATINEASISSLRVSSLSDYSPTGASFSTTSISSIVSVNLSSLVSNVRLSLISTMQFQPNISGSLGGVNLGMGNFLGGIVGGLGSGVFNTALAGAALATGIVALTNTRTNGFAPGTTNNYQLVNTQTQLQFSTLGAATPGFFRFVNSASPQTPGIEYISTFTIPSGTIAVRSMSDPLNLANSTIVTSTIQSFGSWVPLPQPAVVPTDNILALTVSSINTIGWDQIQYQNQTPVPNANVRTYTVVAGVNDVFCVSATSSAGGGLFQSRAAILTPGIYSATAFCAMVRSRIINLDALYPNPGSILLFQNLFVQPLPSDTRYISFANTNTGLSPSDTSYTYSWNPTYAPNYPPATGAQMTQSATLFGANTSVIGYSLAPGLAIFVPLPLIGGTPTNTPLPFGPNIQVSSFIASTMVTTDKLTVYNTFNPTVSTCVLGNGFTVNISGSGIGTNTTSLGLFGVQVANGGNINYGSFYESKDIARFRIRNVTTFDNNSAPMEIGNRSTIFGSNIGPAASNGYVKFDAPVYFNSSQPVSMSTLTVSTINSFNWSTISLYNQADAIINPSVTVVTGVNDSLCITASSPSGIFSYDVFTLTAGVYPTLAAFIAMVNPLFQFFPDYDSLSLVLSDDNPSKLSVLNGNGSSLPTTYYTLHFNPADASLPWPTSITGTQITANSVLMGAGVTNITVIRGQTQFFPDYPGTPVIGKVPFGPNLQFSTLAVSDFIDSKAVDTQTLVVSESAEGPDPTQPTQFATKQYVDNQIILRSGLTGQIVLYSSPVCPVGYLVCDGKSYSTTTYPDLYAVIKNYYGGAPGSFNVPDLQTRVPRGTISNQLINCSVTLSTGTSATQMLIEVTPPPFSVSGNWQIVDGMSIQVPATSGTYTVQQVVWTNPVYAGASLTKIQYICNITPPTSPLPGPPTVLSATAIYLQPTAGAQAILPNSVGYSKTPYNNTLAQNQIPTHTHGYTVFKGGAGAYNANGGPEPLGQPNVPAYGATTTDGLDSTGNPNGVAADVTGQFPGSGLSTIVYNLTPDPYTIVNYIIKT